MAMFLSLNVRSVSGERAKESLTDYDEFRMHYRDNENTDTIGYSTRKSIFEKRLSEVNAWNSQTVRSWTAVLNRYSDYTDGEMSNLRNFKRMDVPIPEPSSFLAKSDGKLVLNGSTRHQENGDATEKRRTKQYQELVSASFDHAQGECGSCWAHAAVGALEAEAEYLGYNAVPLSVKQVTDEIHNPRKCGGTGGCGGATGEMAYEYLMNRGICSKDEYEAKGGDCKPVVAVNGFHRLRANDFDKFDMMVKEGRPLIVSVFAGTWSNYGKGIFNNCDANAQVDHAVQTVGYGTDSGVKEDPGNKIVADYFLIKNSWGSDWGENGYIRLANLGKRDLHCGWDDKPLDGIYCAAPVPGQKQIEGLQVCGMCGVYNDAAFPLVAEKQ